MPFMKQSVYLAGMVEDKHYASIQANKISNIRSNGNVSNILDDFALISNIMDVFL